MRLRNKPWAEEKMKDYPQYVPLEPEIYKGNWQSRFKSCQPIHIEIGSGKGQFIIRMAKANPHINFIAVEIQTSVAISILELQLDAKLANLQILNDNGRDLDNFFDKGEISRIYLNFSDPWPKSRHEKRRLTSQSFLDLYRELLTSEGEIHFKTDNQGLFEYSLASLSQNGYRLRQVWLDLHTSEFNDNILTEYEERFSSQGHPIYRLEAYLPPLTH